MTIFSGVSCGDLLDLHAALGRGHEGDAPAVAVDDRAEVELARDVEPLLDVEAPHLLPLGARLVRDELHAEDLLGELARLGGAALGDLDAAALAAAAGVDLRLDDDDRALGLLGEALRGGLRLVDREGGVPLGDGDAVAGEELLGLILVDFHVVASSASRVPRSGRDIGLGAGGGDPTTARFARGRAGSLYLTAFIVSEFRRILIS